MKYTYMYDILEVLPDKEIPMLKPLLHSMWLSNMNLERRKQQRTHADFMFESHRDICKLCDGKSYFQIKDPEHPCDEGFRLAIMSSMANRSLRSV